MKKVTLLFALAVLLPSLVLAWLAVRSLRDQQFLLERQQSLLCQSVTDVLAQTVADELARQQADFAAQVETLAGNTNLPGISAQFDGLLRKQWPMAEVGFCVTMSGQILSPLPNGRDVTKKFYADNGEFVGNRVVIEVYNSGALAVLPPNQNFDASGRNSSSFNWPARNNTIASSSQHQGAAPTVGNSVQAVENDSSQQMIANNAIAVRGQIDTDQPSQQLSNPNSSRLRNEQQRQGSQQPMPSVQNAVINNLRQLNSQAANSVRPQGEVSQQIIQPRQTVTQAAPPSTQNPAADEPQQLAANPVNMAAATAELPQQAFSGGSQNTLNYKSAQQRKVMPQQNSYLVPADNAKDDNAGFNNYSRVVAAESEFRQLVGTGMDGMFARFVQNKLRLMVWHRLATQPDYVFGAQLDINRVVDSLRTLIQSEPAMQDDICLALLDDTAKPVVLSRDGFQAPWKRPFVATEVGEALPHWEVAAYLVDPARLQQAAHTTRLTLGLLVALLLFAIAVGSWLVFHSLGQELKLARQKTDFVSNVSHELKTPLTSIRMFSELLAEGRVADPCKQRSYLNIITAEAGRLTRLINNVLDFSRMERGEKKYHFQAGDLTEIVAGAAETFRPHLEASGFQFTAELPEAKIPVKGDADALSQVLVNLLSNAEKYSNGADSAHVGRPCGGKGSEPASLVPPIISCGVAKEEKVARKEVVVQLLRKQSPLPHAEIRVMDRGTGVPRGCEEKIFEKFYRAHDSLGNGIQGSGLGLTIARQIVRAHGGEVTYEPREGGGSCFIVRLPISETTT